MKIAIVGMGAVGTELVGLIVYLTEMSEIVAIDISREKAEAEMWDYAHTTAFPFTENPRFTVGDYADAKDSDIVVITAGAQIQKGQSRDALARTNSALTREIIVQIERYAPQAIVIMVANPVDLVTHVALHASSFPRTRLIGTGTVVDSARFMQIMSNHLQIDPKNIFGYVLGEHGQTGFIPWSICNVCGLDIDTYCHLNDIPPVEKESLHHRVLDAGFEIFNRKGNTNHGIAASIFRIIRAIISNEHSVLPVGVLLQGEYGVADLVMSVPCVIGRDGVQKILRYEFAAEELSAFRQCEAHIRELVQEYATTLDRLRDR